MLCKTFAPEGIWATNPALQLPQLSELFGVATKFRLSAFERLLALLQLLFESSCNFML